MTGHHLSVDKQPNKLVTVSHLAQLHVVFTEGSLKFHTPTAASSLMVSIDL